MAAKTYLNYIDGDWTPSSTGETFDLINPATCEIIASAQHSDPADMSWAIDCAERAFWSTSWRNNPGLRRDAFLKLAGCVSHNLNLLADLNTANNGKTLNDSRTELMKLVDLISYYAGLTMNVFGRAIEPAQDAFSVLIREPLGVVGVISPWNFPLTLMLRAAIPALAAGNAVVLKPASLTAAISMEFVELLSETGAFPKGMVNAVTGPGQTLGELLAKSEKVGMISFTGDNSTGRRVAELGAVTMKKVALELGGKSPNILFADADLNKALPTAVKAAFSNCGQVCMAARRLVVQDTIFDRVVEGMKTALESLIVGDGRDERTQMGPLISRKQMETVLEYIELGKQEGNLITGGYRLQGPEYDRGFFVAPTLFTDLENDSRLVQEEIFGPVLIAQKFHTEEEAIEIANGTRYGLAAAVWTLDVNRAIRVAKAMQAGTVWVNSYRKTYCQAEFGGYKESGAGRTTGIEGMLECTQLKHINFDLAAM
ncbi:MAG: aldehyde dehydrogenase family protein [Syntrophobacteraceae bacterium]|nr:aldehyde dehydrogenase family protein [Syntrophobacteraceae bacterium]